MIRVLVAEDSATARALLVSILASAPDIVVGGEARTGTEAVAKAEQLEPDLITMDVQMPELGGLEATRQIMTRSPRPILVVSSAANTDVELSLEATRASFFVWGLRRSSPPGVIGDEDLAIYRAALCRPRRIEALIA